MRNHKRLFENRLARIALGVLSLLVLMVVLINPWGLAAVGAGLALVPIWGSVKDETFKKLTAEQVAELEQSEQNKYFNELEEYNKAKMKAFKEQLKKENTESLNVEIAKLREEMIESNLAHQKAILETQEIQGKALNKLLSKGVGSEPLTLEKELESIKDDLEKSKPNKDDSYVQVKTLVARSAVNGNQRAYELPDIGQIPTAERNAWSVFPKIRISDKNDNGVIRYYDWDEDTYARAAAMVAEGGTFPESTAAWVTKLLEIRKIGDSIPYTKEMQEDSAQFAAELSMFIDTNVKIKENSQLINGDGTGDNFKGLLASIEAYTPVASQIEFPTLYDLIVKVKEKIQAPYGGKYRVDVAFMNLVDINRYKLEKDQNGNYILPPFYDAGGNRIDGVTIIEDNEVTANTLAMGDRRFGRIYEKTGYEMATGYVNDQFIKDEETLKVRKRGAFLIRNIDKTGFLKVTDIDNAIAVLGQ